MNDRNENEHTPLDSVTEQASRSCLRRRSWRLAGVLLMISASPLVSTLMSLDMATLPLYWATYALPIGVMMILAFWVGMGSAPIIWRLVLLVTACFYLALWNSIADSLVFSRRFEFGEYVWGLAPYLAIAFAIAGMFAILRLRLKLTVADIGSDLAVRRFQFTVFHLLVVMSATATVLSLMREARGDKAAEVDPISWQSLAGYALVVVAFFANTAGAAIAVLGQRPLRRNILLVLVASLMLGAAISFTLRQNELGWWIFAGGVLSMVLPTVVVLMSLLWLRPCGLRLVRRKPASLPASGLFLE